MSHLNEDRPLTKATKAAQEQGLAYAGFGTWRDSSGKVVARSVDGGNRLEPISGDDSRSASEPKSTSSGPPSDVTPPRTTTGGSGDSGDEEERGKQGGSPRTSARKNISSTDQSTLEAELQNNPNVEKLQELYDKLSTKQFREYVTKNLPMLKRLNLYDVLSFWKRGAFSGVEDSPYHVSKRADINAILDDAMNAAGPATINTKNPLFRGMLMTNPEAKQFLEGMKLGDVLSMPPSGASMNYAEAAEHATNPSSGGPATTSIFMNILPTDDNKIYGLMADDIDDPEYQQIMSRIRDTEMADGDPNELRRRVSEMDTSFIIKNLPNDYKVPARQFVDGLTSFYEKNRGALEKKGGISKDDIVNNKDLMSTLNDLPDGVKKRFMDNLDAKETFGPGNYKSAYGALFQAMGAPPSIPDIINNKNHSQEVITNPRAEYKIQELRQEKYPGDDKNSQRNYIYMTLKTMGLNDKSPYELPF